MIYQENIGETKTTYDGTPEEIAELYSKLNLPEELTPPNIFNPVDNTSIGIKAVSQKLKEQSEPVNINSTVNGEVDAEKVSKEACKIFNKLAFQMGYIDEDEYKKLDEKL